MSRHSSNTSSQCSADFSSTAGTSYTLILDHILNYPGTYEIPLRTMYTLNSTPRAQPSRPATPTGPQPVGSEVAAQFHSSLINQVSSLPSQPCSLPPTFITTFLRRCFPADLTQVDFPQALTALDYLKDLETRRRREFRAALLRLNISTDTFKPNTADDILQKNPGVAAWLNNNEKTERRIESYYTQLYVSLRRWLLINELSLAPFSKHNCLAMLNTLYPPPGLNDHSSAPSPQPTGMLTPQLLKAQRAGFFEWIKKVEHHGPAILEPLMQQGKRRLRHAPNGAPIEDENGWPAVRDCLDSYLRVANAIIDDCRDISSLADFDHSGRLARPSSSDRSPNPASGRESRSGRKADSGVSFNSSDDDHPARLPPAKDASPPAAFDARFPPPPPPKPAGSALEKLARELKKMRIGRSAPPPPPPAGPKSRPASPSPRSPRIGGGAAVFPPRRDSSADRAPPRPRSRANTFVRSFSRARAASSASASRPQTAVPADDVPPTPTVPMSFMDHSSDSEGDGAPRGRLRRSLSIARAHTRGRSRSASRVPRALRKMKSMGDAGARGREGDRLFGSLGAGPERFDLHEMRAARARWEATQAPGEAPFAFDDAWEIGTAV